MLQAKKCFLRSHRTSFPADTSISVSMETNSDINQERTTMNERNAEGFWLACTGHPADHARLVSVLLCRTQLLPQLLTYLPTYLPTYLHVSTYLPTCLPTYLPACLPILLILHNIHVKVKTSHTSTNHTPVEKNHF